MAQDKKKSKKSPKKGSSSKDAKKGMSAAKKAFVVFAVAIAVVLGCCCFAFASIESTRSQYVPENTMLDGQVDVSGMTEQELRDLLNQRIDNNVATTIILNMGDTARTIEMEEIGTIDIDRTVEQAFAPYRKNVLEKLVDGVAGLMGGGSKGYDICTVCLVDHDVLASRIEGIAEEVNTAPKNAGYAYDKGTNTLVVAPAVDGIEMNVDAAIDKIEAALGSASNGDPSRLNIDTESVITKAESDEPGQGIFVDTRNCKVHLYEDGKQVASYACTPGMSGYATPKGDFTLSYKDAAPTWYNPHSDWSQDMEEVIPPGPTNPLGLRALAVSCGGGIFLHGTTNTGGLGRPGSHGCVRLSNNNIVELYDRVSAGIPIIIR